MDGYEDEDIDEEDLDDMELEDDEEDILYDDLEEDIDEERVLVGCKSLRQPFGIEKFIADRQREELHRKNNGE